MSGPGNDRGERLHRKRLVNHDAVLVDCECAAQGFPNAPLHADESLVLACCQPARHQVIEVQQIPKSAQRSTANDLAFVNHLRSLESARLVLSAEAVRTTLDPRIGADDVRRGHADIKIHLLPFDYVSIAIADWRHTVDPNIGRRVRLVLLRQQVKLCVRRKSKRKHPGLLKSYWN